MDIAGKRWPFVYWVSCWPGARACREVAETLGGISAAKTPSIERRLSRFLANQQIVVIPLWTQLLGALLRFWRARRLVFVLDATSLDDRASVLYLGLLVHFRLLPVSWQVLPATSEALVYLTGIRLLLGRLTRDQK